MKFVDCNPVMVELREENDRLRDLLQKCVETLDMVQAVRACMMFESIHDDQSSSEILSKHGAIDVQDLARIATDRSAVLQDRIEQVLKGEK